MLLKQVKQIKYTLFAAAWSWQKQKAGAHKVLSPNPDATNIQTEVIDTTCVVNRT